MGDRRAIEPLVATLNDPVADVRFNAAIALARFDDRRAVPVLREMLDRSRLDRIEGMRPEQKEATILAALPAMLKLAPEEARPLLGPLSTSDPSLQVQSAAREALRN
jgi:HEAT repeat protein